MMLALGFFVFMRQTLPFQGMQREAEYRWPSNSRVGRRDASSFSASGRKKSRSTACFTRKSPAGR